MGQQPSSPKPGTRFQVIGAGMSRTGTKTLNEALSILLDGPVHDSGIHCFGGTRRQQDSWLEIMELAPKAKTISEKKRIEYLLADVLEGYSSTMDTPANMMVAEMLNVFPDAIVICTTRDPIPWAISMYKMAEMSTTFYAPWLCYWIPGISNFSKWFKLHEKLIAHRLGYTGFRVESIRDHEEKLRGIVPPEKLFFYRVSEGWGPLCKILNVPIPDRPFPHNNNTNDARQVYREIVIAGSIAWLLVITVASSAIWLAWRFGWRRYF